MTGFVVLFLVVAPLVSIFTGRLADAAGLRAQGAERAWHQVTAVLQESAAQGQIGQDGAWGAAWVGATWKLPDGRPHTGIIAVGLNARAGQRVTIWVTGSGRVTHPPLTRAEVLDGIANAVMATVAAVGVLVGLMAAVVRAMVNRRRMADWARAWAVIGPRWTSLR